jgi:hypothetical protein
MSTGHLLHSVTISIFYCRLNFFFLGKKNGMEVQENYLRREIDLTKMQMIVLQFTVTPTAY